MRVVEMFSGIGSQAKALNHVCARHNFQLEILNTCEWDIHAIIAYDYIHNGFKINKKASKLTKEYLVEVLSKYSLSNDGKKPMTLTSLKAYSKDALERIYSSILNTHNLINVKEVKGKDLPNNLDLLTYSFPCQDLSNMGSLHGYNKGIDRGANTRSGLLWEIERILNERKDLNLDMPRFLLLENVTTLEANRHKGNFEEWQNVLTHLGYINKVYRLKAINSGIPQNRKRLIMLSVYVGDDIKMKMAVEHMLAQYELNGVQVNRTRELAQFLRLDYSNLTYFKEALEAQPNATPSRIHIRERNAVLYNDGVIADIVPTITTKQDRHPNSGNIYFDPKNGKANFRFLTPRECFLLMGFSEEDIQILYDHNFVSRKNSKFFNRDKLYKLAGNSIVVPMLESVFEVMARIMENT